MACHTNHGYATYDDNWETMERQFVSAWPFMLCLHGFLDTILCALYSVPECSRRRCDVIDLCSELFALLSASRELDPLM